MKVDNFAHPPRNVAAFGISPGMSVADFGSGSGAYVLLLAEALAGSGHVYAVDIQKDLLRRTYNEAKRRGFHDVKVLWGDLERPGGSKIADNVLDLVLISNLLFQVEDKAMLVAEAHRVLKHGGRLVIIDWAESFGGMGPQKADVVTKGAATALAMDSGFVFDKEFAAGAHHYGLIFHKS
jgi:ubiquinone/menaquinone biosynthesis C-methylase UbiE